MFDGRLVSLAEGGDSVVRVTDELSQRLRAVAFLCACLVVPIHCWSVEAWFAGKSGLHIWEAALAFLLTDTISRCAVPCFFVFSGYFLALKFIPTGNRCCPPCPH